MIGKIDQNGQLLLDEPLEIKSYEIEKIMLQINFLQEGAGLLR
jgi:hypothetical protein